MALLWEHHIIPRCFAGHPALKGIDINAPENLVYLPQSKQLAARMGLSPHSGRHLDSYFAVRTVLDKLVTMSDPVRIAELGKLQDAMRIGLGNGDLYTNNPGTDADPESINQALLVDYNSYHERHPEEVQDLEDIRQQGIDTGNPNLQKFSPYLGNPERERLLSEAIADNPGVKITARNKDLGGTPWNPNFTATDDDFYIPPSTPTNPDDVPSLPPFIPPSLPGLSEPEGLTRSDPHFAGVLPAFPGLSQSEQRLGQLPPTTATPSDPLVLKYDPMTGAPLPFYESPLASQTSANGSSLAQDLLPWLAGAAAAGIAIPFLPTWLLLLGGGLAILRAANAEGVKSETAGDVVTDEGVFSTGAGAPGYKRLNSGGFAGNANGSSDYAGSSIFGLTGHAPLDQNETATSTFADRFGNWTGTPTGTVPAQNLEEKRVAVAAGAVAPDDVRRLTRANESNAGSVFTTGSAPVPYLPSTGFNDRFGNWRTPTGDGGASRPISAFADEPSCFIPPPIFGSHDSSSDTDEWFSRWIRPLLRPD